jgi:hypothetical protein
MELRELLLNPSLEMIEAGVTALDDCVDHDWDSGGDGEGYNSYTTIRSDAPSIVFKAMVAVALKQSA